MTILIVDDQISVVSALIFGINWSKFGDCRVLKAYNAFEAREQLLKHKVDILLCDIEMPVENGLSLFKWMKEQGMDAECIFLTAHADFIYAKEAIRLGSFDYILQPARYEDIENSLFRTIEKINQKKKSRQINSLGEMVIQQKELILNEVMKEWLEGGDGFTEGIRNKLLHLDITLTEDIHSWLIFIKVGQLKEKLSDWSNELIKYALKNILSELLFHSGQEALACQLQRDEYFFYIYPAEPANRMEKELLADLLNRFAELVYRYYNTNLVCYYIGCEDVQRVKEKADRLLQLKERQLALGRVVCDAASSFPEEENCHFSFSDILPNLEELLQYEMYDTACEEVAHILEERLTDNSVSAEFLERFYQEFMRVVYLAANNNNCSVNQIFESTAVLKRALNAYSSIDEMFWLIRTVNEFFNEYCTSQEKKKSQIDQILLYIRSNLEEDIKRTDIAAAVHLNPNYVSRLFKNEMGISPKEYIIREKMNLARQMVKNTNLRISMIAMKVGYTNFSHFTQVYKRMFDGVTPAEDRESFCRKKE